MDLTPLTERLDAIEKKLDRLIGKGGGVVAKPQRDALGHFLPGYTAGVRFRKGHHPPTEFKPTHGMTGGPTYKAWAAMLQRTTNPNAPNWKDYGGKGIAVCARWKVFTAFLADMGEKTPGLMLDRIDKAGDFTPENCRWGEPCRRRRRIPAVIAGVPAASAAVPGMG